MKAFAGLFRALDESNKTTAKVAALASYFRAAPPESAAWALFWLTGRRNKRVITASALATWACECSGIAEWLFRESRDAVGDLSETIALILPDADQSNDEPLHLWADRLLDLRALDASEQRLSILKYWESLDARQRFVWNKLLLGNFRVGVSQQLVVRGLSEATGVPVTHLTERLMGDWAPSRESYLALTSKDETIDTGTRPYPFFLASPLEGSPDALGALADWQIEWKWDGIRAQLVKRASGVALWSRGDELITERFPELQPLMRKLPLGCALDGELLAWRGDAPLPFSVLQQRINRKHVTQAIIRKSPVCLVAYDLLEWGGTDIRAEHLAQRRAVLEKLVGTVALPEILRLSPTIAAADWLDLGQHRDASRSRGAEGLMLKRSDSPYRAGRIRGDWWKWKVAPLTLDAVLTAAQRGSGKRASLYTDYTFSIWKDGALVPFAKAYSGLTDQEIQQVDAFVRTHMTEKFGPVRTVEARLVFELGFEHIARSTRHKSGIAVRFPRILRWRQDKTAADADTFETASALLDSASANIQGSTGNKMREGLLFDL